MSDSPCRFRVFIVDDSALMRDRLADLFDTVPLVDVVGGADNVPGAVTRIRAGGIDAVILDLDLNGGNGLDVLKSVKTGRPAPVVIVLSIHPFSEFGAHCQAAGADYYFEKGSSFDGIIKLLEDLAQRHARVAR